MNGQVLKLNNDETVQEIETTTQENTSFSDNEVNQLYQIFDSYFTKKSEQIQDTSNQDNLDNQTIIIDKLDRVHNDIQYTNNLIYFGIVISLVIFFSIIFYKFLKQFMQKGDFYDYCGNVRTNHYNYY